MSIVKDSIFLRALNREHTPRTPVWVMRQAGRYLPEYRKIRAEAGNFMTLCQTPELACEVTLQPLRRFQLDAAIVFSDILTIPDALGLGLHFVEGEGPQFTHPLRDKNAILNLPLETFMDKLNYVADAVSMVRKNMPAELPLIGFSGSPWTLACYMVEGKGSRDFHRLFRWLYEDRITIDLLLTQLADAVIEYLSAQVEAGANALMIFDTWGGLLPFELYETCSLKHMETIIAGVRKRFPEIPIILFSKGASIHFSKMAKSGAQGLGVDWTCTMQYAREMTHGNVALQGNLHPALLTSTPEAIEKGVKSVLDSYGYGHGHIFNLGHGITPDVPYENLEVMIEAVRKHSPKYHIAPT